MIQVSKGYVEKIEGKDRLCAKVNIDKQEQLLWFMAEGLEKGFQGVGDESFLLALLPYAMQKGEDLLYEGCLTKRLVHEWNQYLIPSMAAARKDYKKIRLSTKGYCLAENRTAKGAAMCFFDEAEFANRIEAQKADGLYPLTHLVAFYAEKKARDEAQKYGLRFISFEHNLNQFYKTETKDTKCILELAGALTLGGECGVYFYYAKNVFLPDPSRETKNLDVVWCSFTSTNKLKIYLLEG